MDALKETRPQNFCVSCGLCCDGTIFTHIVLQPEEIAAAKRKGFRIEQRGSQLFCRLPCPHLHDRKCSSYASWRPFRCAEFACNVLKRIEAGELSFDEGTAIVERTVLHLFELCSKMQVEYPVRQGHLAEEFAAWQKRQVSPDKSVELSYATFQFRLSRDFGKGEK